LQVAKNISRREWKVNTLNYDKIEKEIERLNQILVSSGKKQKDF
jgi:hypothetical protein